MNYINITNIRKLINLATKMEEYEDCILVLELVKEEINEQIKEKE